MSATADARYATYPVLSRHQQYPLAPPYCRKGRTNLRASGSHTRFPMRTARVRVAWDRRVVTPPKLWNEFSMVAYR